MARLSLRGRLLFGAILWTVGLFLITSTILTQLVFTNPRPLAFFHHMFAHQLMMAGIAAFCMIVGLIQVRQGVSAVSQLRERLADIHAGRESRMQGDYPAEVEPLVADLNRLLDSRDTSVARAQAKAGDLAHGLKTPLAVLAQEGDRARTAGLVDLSTTITQEVERMRRQIDYHLAHARAAASGATPGVRTSVAESVDGLTRTLERLHADRGLRMTATSDPSHMVRGQRQDVDEMLGNLLDNACKWAKTRVDIHSAIDAGYIVITVNDDGPGLDPAMREAVLRRGVRADEAAPGSGLGLAIVRDLAGVYGGTITLGTSAAGGLSATLRLPVG